MRCWTYGAALAVLAIGVADALDNCDSNVLVNAYAGLNVNSQLVTCMTQNNFSAALDGSVDLTSVNAATAPEQVKTICASDSCKTILSALVGSANFNLTNCIVGNNIVLMTEISNLQATCTAISTGTTAPAATTAAPAATTAAPVATTAAPVATTAAPVATTAAPVATTAAPAATTAAPVATTAAPVATTAAPVATTAAPVATTAAPVATTAAPVATTATPVATTAAPVATTAAPVVTTAAPVATTAAPVATTAAPVATTAAPVATTAAPVATTAAPVATTATPTDDPTQQQQQTFSVLNSDNGSNAGVSPGMASLAGNKRPAEDPAVSDSAEPARKLTKTQRRRERKQTPAQKIEYQYRIQVQICAQQNDATRALEVYEEMISEGVKVEPYIYNMVINVCSKAEDTATFKTGAYKVYQDMKTARANAKQKKKSESEEPMYSAMIKLCSKAQDFDACETILAEMETDKVDPKLRTFGPLLQAYSDAGNVDKCVWVHEKLLSHELELTEDDYVALLRVCVKAGNAERFYAFLDSFIDEIWQPSLSTWDVLKDWFNSEAAQVDGRKWKITEGTVSQEGVCSVSGDQLQSVELSVELTTELLAKIEQLVRTDEKRMEQWDEFKKWLEEFGPFDVIIDAANVGYCNQNFEGGGFNYEQIDLMVTHYEAQSKKVLVVLHERRTSDEQVPVERRAQIAEWRTSRKMFNCQPGNNDDWYWLYAAVKLGGRTLMVSNDEMRDHHFQMIHNRAFGRWKERHQVHYQVHGRRVTVEEPLPFSERPQHVGDNWHFPTVMIDDSTTETPQVADRKWLCVELTA